MKRKSEKQNRIKLPKKLRFSGFFRRRLLLFLLAAAVIDVRAFINIGHSQRIAQTSEQKWWDKRVDSYFTAEEGSTETKADEIVRKFGIPHLVSRLTNSLGFASNVPTPYSECSVMLVQPERFEYYISGAQVALMTMEKQADQEEGKSRHYFAEQEEAEKIVSETVAYSREHLFSTHFREYCDIDPVMGGLFSVVADRLIQDNHFPLKGPAFEGMEPLQAYVNEKDETCCGIKYAWTNEYTNRCCQVYTHDAEPEGGWELRSNLFYMEQENGQYVFDAEAHKRYVDGDQPVGAEYLRYLAIYGYPADCYAGSRMREIAAHMDGNMSGFRAREQELKEIISDQSGKKRYDYYHDAYASQLQSMKDGWSDTPLSEAEIPSPEEELAALYRRVGEQPERMHNLYRSDDTPLLRVFGASEYYCTTPVVLNGEQCYLFLYEYEDNLMLELPHLVFMNMQMLILAVLASLLWGWISYLRKSRKYEMEEYRRSLTATLAHDLKSPLTAISGYAENLNSDVHPEKQEHYSGAILENTQYMDSIIANVLELSKLEQQKTVKRRKTDVMELIRGMQAQRQTELEQRELHVTVSGDCMLKADRGMLTVAVGNLLDNAVKYTPQGGSIRITGEKHALRIENDTETEAIADPAALCEPFVKGDDARSNRTGTGLGLSTVRRIVQLNRLHLDLACSGHRFTAVIRK